MSFEIFHCRSFFASLAMLVMLALCTAPVAAKQYESSMRIVADDEAEAEPVADLDEEELLAKLSDSPYAKALTLRQLAGKAMKEGKAKKARNYLEKAVELNALSGLAQQDMQVALAQLYARTGEYQKVIEILEPWIAKNPDSASSLYIALGGAYAQKKQYKPALKYIQTAIKREKRPNPAWLRLLLAIRVELKQYKLAIPLAKRLVAEDPADADLWWQWASMHLALKEKEKAVAVLELAHRMGRLTDGDQLLQFARLFISMNAPFEAAQLLERWTAEGRLPRDAAILDLLSTAWMRAREYQQALPVLREAARLTGSPNTYLQLAKVHLDLGNWKDASDALSAALRKGGLGNNTSIAWMSLGMARYQNEDIQGAMNAFKSAKRYKSVRALANQWISYLNSGLARENAIRMSASRRGGGGKIESRFGAATIELAQREAKGNDDIVVDPITPVGAETAGNAAGTIPVWRGGLTGEQAPAGYVKGDRPVDPFDSDKPKFVITAANMEQYAENLAPSHRQLLLRDASYVMPVYETRRTAAYPQEIYEATMKNEPTAKLEGSDAIANSRLGFPFRSPENGVEIMWNHRLRYRGDTVSWQTTQAVAGPRSDTIMSSVQADILYRYGNVSQPADLSKENLIVYLVFRFVDGNSFSGAVLVHETANSIKKRRGIWVYIPGMRRMFRVPPVGYDQPMPSSGGLAFVDMIDMYNGAFDRYVWKLIGKREIYIPYNAYRYNDGKLKNKEVLGKNHLNQDVARYELHRVWLIEATERGGKNHKFGKRVFYVDEDSWNVALVENYVDDNNKIWRFQEGHLIQNYDQLFTNAYPVVTYDFSDGRYFVERLTNEDPAPKFNVAKFQKRRFTPASVKAHYGH